MAELVSDVLNAEKIERVGVPSLPKGLSNAIGLLRLVEGQKLSTFVKDMYHKEL